MSNDKLEATFHPNYWPGIDTSQEAGEHNPEARARMKVRVMLALIHAGEDGLTDHELHDLVAPGSPDGGPRNRRVELVRAGLVEEIPKVRRPSRTGTTSMKVWRAKPNSKGEGSDSYGGAA